MKIYFKILAISAILVVLYILSQYSYLAFHTFIEIFSIIVAYGVFMIAWNSKEFNQNSYFLLLGISFLFIGNMTLMYLMHTMAYKGMNIFPNNDSNFPENFLIGAKYLESITLLIAPFFLKKRIKVYTIFIIYAIIFSFFVFTIFDNIFPMCYSIADGLTVFQIFSEYIILIILIGSLFVMYNKRKSFGKKIFIMIIISIVFTIISEIAFVLNARAFESYSFMYPIFKLLAFYLIYKALVEECYKRIDEYAEIIQQPSEQSMNLLSNLMIWAQSQTGTMKFNPEEVEIIGLINQTTQLLDNAFQQKAITISRKSPAKVIVTADEDMILTILWTRTKNGRNLNTENCRKMSTLVAGV